MYNPQNTYVAIMAGGVGSRFWPASRTARPKQFLDITGVGKSLLRLTFERFQQLCPTENIFIVTNGIYQGLVREQLPEIQDSQILCEPTRNNTAPCVAYAAFKLQALNPHANMIVAPSDHIILQENRFLETLREALTYTAANDALLTLGIRPSRPDTGYGYIQYRERAETGQVHAVKRFTEKPPLAQAREFMASGDYLWNAGIFIWRTSRVLAAFERYAPEIFEILGSEPHCYNTTDEQDFIDRAYPTTPNISIDYAIMEKANNVFTIPSDFGWSDLGTWGSLHAESTKDEHGNAIQGEYVRLYDVHNCLIRVPTDKLVVVKDLQDFIVVDEGDILLIHPKGREQEIKDITGKIGDEYGEGFV